jgi:hypothetical protein
LFFRFLAIYTLKISVPNQLRHNSLTLRLSSHKTKGSKQSDLDSEAATAKEPE